MKELNITYKRGEVTIDLRNEGFGVYTEKCYEVFVNGKKWGYIQKDDIEWRAYENVDAEFYCAGDTLRECKAIFERVIAKDMQVEELVNAMRYSASAEEHERLNEQLEQLDSRGTLYELSQRLRQEIEKREDRVRGMIQEKDFCGMPAERIALTRDINHERMMVSDLRTRERAVNARIQKISDLMFL